MKVAITGASGFIGRYVVQRLAGRDHAVVALGRDRDRLTAAFDGDRVACRVTDYEEPDLREHLSDCDVVVHLAARRPISDPDATPPNFEAFYGPNVRTTENVLRAAADTAVDRVCQASSISVYGGSRAAPYTEDQRPVPAGAYGASKVTCENLADIVQGSRDLEVASLRIGSTYGVGERTLGVLMTFVERAREGRTLTVWGRGEHAPDFVYVEDVVDAVEAAVAPAAPSGVFNVGSGRSWPIAEVARTVNRVFGNDGNLEFDPEKADDGRAYHMDCSRAAAELDWEPSYALEDGLRDMRERYRGR
jgi:UDP-glucose 4-epimerase